MMNYKITSHFMPWEIDYAQLMFIQLKKSKYYLSGEDNISIEVVLNLSDYLIDWNKSQLPKNFFIQKFKSLAPLLEDYNFTQKVYEGNELYGHLDATRETIEPHIDYYINICPDMYFSEQLLNTMIESSKMIKNKYFVLIPEICKLWDSTWDEITNKKYIQNPYKDWDNIDIFDIRWDLKNSEEQLIIKPTEENKWAGWFDLYNKAFWEELCPINPKWKGYGPHDLYSMICSTNAKRMGIDFQQWVIENQVIFEYSVGPLKENGFSKYYKEFLDIKNIPNQRLEFESKLPQYLSEWAMKNKK